MSLMYKADVRPDHFNLRDVLTFPRAAIWRKVLDPEVDAIRCMVEQTFVSRPRTANSVMMKRLARIIV